MDISNITIDDTKIYLRSAVIIETNNGYIFEKDKVRGLFYIVGGGIQVNESSEEAAKREALEELNINIDKIELKAIVERFFSNESNRFHGIEFFYYCKIESIELPEGFCYFKQNEIIPEKTKPEIINDIIENKQNGIIHLKINK